jgi:hypothetical protein
MVGFSKPAKRKLGGSAGRRLMKYITDRKKLHQRLLFCIKPSNYARQKELDSAVKTTRRAFLQGLYIFERHVRVLLIYIQPITSRLGISVLNSHETTSADPHKTQGSCRGLQKTNATTGFWQCCQPASPAVCCHKNPKRVCMRVRSNAFARKQGGTEG